MRTAKLTFIVVVFCLLSALASCKPKAPADTPGTGSGETPGETAGQPEDVTLITSDGIAIYGRFVKGTGTGELPAMLLVHQLSKDSSTYITLQDLLAAQGISSLAIDLRGHGKSTAEGTLDFKAMTLDDWKAATADFDAAMDWLIDRPDVNKDLIGIVGASIGANMAAVYTADKILAGADGAPKALVLLSPGRNYKEYKPLDRGRDLGRIPVYIASSPGDATSFPTSQGLSQAARGGELHEFEGDAHGTGLFEKYPDLPSEIVTWIHNRIAGQAGVDDNSPTEISEPASTDGGGV